MKLMTACVVLLLSLAACGGSGESNQPAASSEPQMTLAEACVEVAELGGEMPIEQADYAPLRDRADELVKKSEPEARAVLTQLRDAYQAGVDASGPESALAAREAERQAFTSLDSACEAVGSPIG